jgi:hypothetical protein
LGATKENRHCQALRATTENGLYQALRATTENGADAAPSVQL